MSDLTTLRDHARARADWQPGETRVVCKDRTVFGTPKPADHTNCGGCGCGCHEPTEYERHMWRQIADEVDGYLDRTAPQVDLFGEESEPSPTPTEHEPSAQAADMAEAHAPCASCGVGNRTCFMEGGYCCIACQDEGGMTHLDTRISPADEADRG